MDVTELEKGKIPGVETGIEIRKSICAICDPSGLCGLDLSVDRSGVICKTEGSAEHPRNRGTLCSKGAATRQYVYHSERVKTPLLRSGPRGSGKFRPVSWDEALDLTVRHLNETKHSYGPESAVFYSGYAKYYRPYLKRLCHSYGSPNYLTEASSCHSAMLMAQRLVYGHQAEADVSNADLLLLWSINPFHASVHKARDIQARLDRGARMIVVDPRETPTTARAHLHLRPRPGTDGALALSMAQVIIEEELYDHDFVDRWSYGFAEYRDYVRSFPPEMGEQMTGVSADLIRRAARMYASARRAALLYSSASIVHHTNGVQNYRAVFQLIGLTGNLDVAGGNRMEPVSFINSAGRIPTRETEFTQCRPWSEMAPRIGSGAFPVWPRVIDEEGQAMALPAQLRTGKPYPVKTLVGFGLNHRMWPAPEAFLESLSHLDFFVNTELFLTDTCKYADLVLPACTSVERSELRCYGSGYIILTQPAIAPLHDSRSDVDIIYELARRLELDDPLFRAGYEAGIDYILAPSGITVEELKRHPGGMPVPNPTPKVERKYLTGGFHTPTGKFEFKSSLLEELGESPGCEALPVYTPPRHSRERTPELAEKYPLVLSSGSRLPMFVHSRTYRMPWTSSLRPGFPSADLSPEDAARLGIAQGDPIRISTPCGSIEVGANITRMTQSGVVHMYHGFPAADVNTLLSADYLDPISGFPGYRSSLCRVDKIGGTNP
ncbi:molybdopterin-dependent oxidoreductase [Pseudoflavonifractor sp. BIOML-A6]|nr:molybdopterin-dependent oxidoreductase [Pseudoflavonifractor sp. BIOML-A16]MTR04966.1 molybdopterin-dependent oxidoreductase [Pseudoflavonifractor sp. BIOML-A15]MTR12480.1 molybdopterin-dependent oxidoreductase [Pseudoflavonifractor sp. BIOML-A17]MTR20363.1 molybdopterin-dependent oxidoreductase [Pseudoflavonifractor sp. BIOML-A19]MTR35490.1 molybdopterin-dependent oxidoreductase [Pseudoflavonifractor sp. BIOML-A9]MTR44007.1 molybdopterin-dependent oxidoreductase [Pseudoflavonifractor sp. B